MPILIDGWNLIRDGDSDIADEEGDYLDSARELISYLKEYQTHHKDPMIVVFDSKHEYIDIDHRNTANLTVIPAKDADDFIMDYVASAPERQRRNIRVVSSDNSVYYESRRAGATPLRSAEFWEKLRSCRQKRRSATCPKSPR
jgi:predicted RNA-binding protein with PIN domain